MFQEIKSLNRIDLRELKKLNDETIAALESDIKLLKWQLKQFGPSAELSFESHTRRYAGSAESQVLLKTIQEEIADMNLRLQQTNHLTGITIDKISRKLLKLDDSHSKTRFDLTLQVMGKMVFLNYEIDEFLFDDDDISSKGSRVTWMELQIGQDTNRVIGEALTKVIENISIQPAMCLITSYVKFMSDRDSLIEHFTRTYSDSVSYSIEDDAHCLDISARNPSQTKFSIVWRVKYKSDSCIVPQVNLKVKGSQKLKDLDSKGVIDSAPEMFEALVSEKGLKSAIDCIIQLVTPSDDSAIETPK